MFVGYLWGIETRLASALARQVRRFVGYLWGIETWMALNALPDPKQVCRLPMRDWNDDLLRVIEESRNAVCRLPMRDWNYNESWRMSTSKTVCRLPMRDWNTTSRFPPSAPSMVCRLPMRDWNWWISEKIRWPGNAFVGYLWGIETTSKVFALIFPLEVCRLPMRDWNKKMSQLKTWWVRVCRLPMRDWNLISNPPVCYTSCGL